MIKLCDNDDGRAAVGTGKRPVRFCRSCYVKEHGPEFQAWKVAIQADDVDGIACAKTGETIPYGGTVWLDPEETNTLALVYGGFIEALPAAAPAKPAKATEA